MKVEKFSDEEIHKMVIVFGENSTVLRKINELVEAVNESNEKVNRIVNALQTLSKWADIQQGIVEHDTIIIDDFNKRLMELEKE